MEQKASRRRAAREAGQLAKLARLLGALGDNRFYAPRVAAAGLDRELESLDAFRARLPFTTKAELAHDQEQHTPYGSNLGRPLADYVRLHQTSSTTGVPLRWLDTPANWAFLKRGWRKVLEAASVTADDRVFVAFSFGPFLGPWLALEAAQDLGALALSGAALSSEARLRAMLANEATVLCCTPTYALRLIEVAGETGVDLTPSRIREIVVGAEPGGSVPSVRERIEAAWPGARLHDHYGLTEAGAVAYPCPLRPDVLHAAESLYLVEVVDRETAAPVAPDGRATGELVVTTLGRADSPVLRYRTGDLVRPLPRGRCACGSIELALDGGVLGRADDRVHVRGVNLYPSAVDAILRRFDGVAEYRVHVRSQRGMQDVELEIEPSARAADAVASAALTEAVRRAFRSSHGLRVEVRCAPPGSLPRFELEARRWTRAGPEG